MERASDIDPANWKAVDRAVLCFIRDREAGEVLLIHKKRGLGAGLINAPGGRIEAGETPENAAIRETREEVRMRVDDLRQTGDLYFQFVDGYSIRGYVFETHSWTGKPVETDEAQPFWCNENDIPYEKMWTDDSWWLPHMLSGQQFTGRFIFDGEIMLSMSLDIAGSDARVGIPKNQVGRRP